MSDYGKEQIPRTLLLLIEPGYGHFEKVRRPAPGKPKWRIKCVKCASGRVLTDKDPGVIWAKKAAQEA